MNLLSIGILYGAAHLAVVYYAVEVARLDYKTMMILNGAVAMGAAVLARALEPEWKPAFMATIQADKREGRLMSDGGGMVLALIASSMASLWLMGRRYGAAGWLGAIGVNAVVNAVV
jgi:hypothetical protein